MTQSSDVSETNICTWFWGETSGGSLSPALRKSSTALATPGYRPARTVSEYKPEPTEGCGSSGGKRVDGDACLRCGLG